MFINIMHIIRTTGYHGAPIENDSHLQLGRLAESAETPPTRRSAAAGVYIYKITYTKPPPAPLLKNQTCHKIFEN